jgi:hypothetical protein
MIDELTVFCLAIFIDPSVHQSGGLEDAAGVAMGGR